MTIPPKANVQAKVTLALADEPRDRAGRDAALLLIHVALHSVERVGEDALDAERGHPGPPGDLGIGHALVASRREDRRVARRKPVEGALQPRQCKRVDAGHRMSPNWRMTGGAEPPPVSDHAASASGSGMEGGGTEALAARVTVATPPRPV